jgi:hypothetical protein
VSLLSVTGQVTFLSLDIPAEKDAVDEPLLTSPIERQAANEAVCLIKFLRLFSMAIG